MDNICIDPMSVVKNVFRKVFYVIILISSCLQLVSGQAASSILSTNPLIQELTGGGDWKYSLYRYQNFDKYPKLNQLYVASYIKKQVEKNMHFEALLYPELKNYSIETYKFEPKVKMPYYPVIFYQPSNPTKEGLKDYKNFINSKSFSNSYEDVFNQRYFIKEAQEKYIYSHLQNVNWSWDAIPDPPRLGRNGFLQKRSASESLNKLLRNNTFETQPSLEKVHISKGPWTIGGTENIQLSQGYVDNWVKGGENNISLSSDLRLAANYKFAKHEWESYIIHKIGVISTDNDPGRVNTDLIEINTKYGHKASDKWYYSFLYNFKTQMFNGYESSDIEKETPISGFLAPAYMSFAVGMDYKPSKTFTLLISPLTSRLTYVSDTVKYDQTKFGVAKDKKTDVLNGISVVNNIKHQIAEGITLTSRLDAFYQYIGKVDEGDDRQVQIDWEVILDMRINRFLSTRFLAQTRYFTNESTKVQFRENFNIAFKYNF